MTRSRATRGGIASGKRLLPLIAALAVAGCGFRPEKIFATYAEINVREVARGLYCNTPADEPRVQLLPDPKAVLDWQAARGVALAGTESLAQSPYAVVEMGTRPTGGYGIAIARSAVLRGELIILNATFVSPAPGSLRTQAVSTPCVLVQLPPGRYRTVQVEDQTGSVRATGGLEPLPSPPAPAQASPPAAEPSTPPPAPESAPSPAPPPEAPPSEAPAPRAA